MKGVVAAQEPMAVEVGVEVLEAGGNAFDAAVAAAFVQTVVNPFQCGLGGWGSATIYDGRSRTSEHLGFWPRIGSRMRPDMWSNDVRGYTPLWNFPIFDDHRSQYGYTAIMTPGTVAGFGELHRKYCTCPWAELLKFSIALSENGFPIPEYVARYGRQALMPGLPHPKDKLCANDAARAIWQRHDGLVLETGEFYRNPDQARTLERLAAYGPADFYQGELAEVISQDFTKNGAFVTKEDLSQYRVRSSKPLAGTYRDFVVESSALPGGGLMVLQMLNILENFNLPMLHHNGPEHARIVAGALAWAGVTRFRYHADPEFTDVPVEWLLSKEYAAELAGRIREGRFPDQQALSKPGGTTHICVADEQGNCVTMTHTLTACSGVIVPGTGFTWNDGVSLMDPLPGRPNSYNPGRARANAVSPTILFRQGSPAVVVGAPGGWSISSAVLQVISNVVDFGMSPQEAVTAPRFHSEGSPVYCDLRVPTATVRSLRNLGVEVEQSLYSYAPIMGRPVCITLDGGMKAGCDARLEGGWPGFARS